MNRTANLFEQLVDWPNLLLAAARARRGKRFRPNVAEFEFRQESELLTLQRQLINGDYRLGSYRTFVIYEPKRRSISAAPYRDRVLHHAVCNIVEPLFERRFIHHSYACRKGKGTHEAINRALELARRFRYVLKADVAQFFPSVDHEYLLARIERAIKDRRLLNLIKQIIHHPFPAQVASLPFPGDGLFDALDRTCGLPIGNQTSQFFGNVMLDPLDHFVTEQLRCRGYVRYADDFLLYSNDKSALSVWRDAVQKFLYGIRLRMHEDKTVIIRVVDGVPFLGCRIFPTHRRLGKHCIRQFKRRLRRLQRGFADGRTTPAEIRQCIVGWWGHARHTDSWRLALDILRAHPFERGNVSPRHGMRGEEKDDHRSN